MTHFNDSITVTLPINCRYSIDATNLVIHSAEIAGGEFTQLSALPLAVQNQIAAALAPAIREYETERKGAFDGRI